MQVIEMQPLQFAIWSAMLGGMTTISLASLADAALTRSRGALLGSAYLAALTFYASLLCGLLQCAFPDLSPALVRGLQVALGPLCCALALVTTGRWLNAHGEDDGICKIMHWAVAATFAVAAGLALAAVLESMASMPALLLAAAVTCLATVALTGMCAWRAYRLGDALAVWVLPTAVAMGFTVAGLYQQAAFPNSMPVTWAALTAFSAVVYLLMVALLSVLRTRQVRRLERLAALHAGFDPTTGLPTGSALVAKVDDQFWRSARGGMACNVVCMHLHNLYDLADVAGHGVEHQIAQAMSARIRRAVGFRSVVGLYHARCFVAIIPVRQESSEQQISHYVNRLRYLLSKPITVTGHQHIKHDFVPDWGIGVVSAHADGSDSNTILRHAERAAMHDGATKPASLDSSPALL